MSPVPGMAATNSPPPGHSRHHGLPAYPHIEDPLPDPPHSFTLTFMKEVKKRRRGATTISSKNQITIPAEALRKAGLKAGERVVARADGAGRVILEREHDVIAEFAGALTGTYKTNELDDLRSEWD